MKEKHTITIPSMGESVSEGILAQWLVPDGAWVKAGDELFELESDKATLAVNAEVEGVVRQTVTAGSTVAIGTAVGTIDPGAPKPESAKASPAPTVKAGPAPVASAPKAPEPAPTKTMTAKDSPMPPAPPASTGERRQETKALSPLRRQIARKLVESQHLAAHLSTFNEVDLGAVKEARERLRKGFEERHGVRLGYMSFFVKAAIKALKEYPEVNSYVSDETVTYNHFYDIAVAVSTEKGLLTPVIRDADRHSFAELERIIADFGVRAGKRAIHPEELAGGTFTISNGGVFGSLLSTPIPNPPQTAILGMHSIQDRPVARDGQVVIRPMMYLALTYDHRILDGREAIGFLKRIKDLLEDPMLLLTEM